MKYSVTIKYIHLIQRYYQTVSTLCWQSRHATINFVFTSFIDDNVTQTADYITWDFNGTSLTEKEYRLNASLSQFTAFW